MASIEQHNWNGSFFADEYKSFGSNSVYSPGNETRARVLREWYRIGQSYFRGFFDKSLHVERLNDALQALSNKSAVEREGFLMGWQSDVYAYENGMEFSVEGMDSITEEEMDYGSAEQIERYNVLDESGFSGSNA
jgi:hypothetical protein